MRFFICLTLLSLLSGNVGAAPREISVIFPHHSMGALLLGSRTYTEPREFSTPEDMHLCRRLDQLSLERDIKVVLHHHDRYQWDSLRDCQNDLIEPSWGKVAMGSDGNTPTHWQRLFIENRWPDVREKMLRYDIIVIKNSYQVVQLDVSPGYENRPDGAYTIIDKMDEWKSHLVDLARYFAEEHPDKILVHLGPAPRRGLSTEGSGIHFPNRAVADATREFADWMATEWVAMAPNIHYFPWFDLLADDNNVMDKRWRSNGSHYKLWRGREIGLSLADYLFDIAAEMVAATGR